MNDIAGSLYQSLAEELRTAISDGRLPAGSRLPSVRETARNRSLSINTVLAAYRQLEARGQVEARPQSGYFVRSRLAEPAGPSESARPARALPAETAVLDRIEAVLAAQSDPATIDLSLACPTSRDFYPGKQLTRLMTETARRKPELLTDYSLPPGPLLLRREICRHARDLGMTLASENIILTNGCMEALQLALRAVTRPGDTVAIESPTYFNLISLADHLGLRAIEVPTHPGQGMSLDALELLLSEKRVQAVVSMPSVHNPLGTSMPVAAKKRLAALAKDWSVPVIEDALYAELQYATPLQPTVKSFDDDGWVILCTSYTKALAPGFRVGWMEAGRFRRRIAALKFSASLAQPAFLGEVIGAYLATGGYAQHLRRLRRLYAAQVDRLRGLIESGFPVGTRATEPTGGFLVWVELPEGCDGNRLCDDALRRDITITPGSLFSPSGRHRRHIRLSACHHFSDRHVHALLTLGELAREQLGG
ncbi:PLP-dependent aminotransferase family protein [Propionivibrio soli]|uniref:aminotransferase-like domain-containing protein n=1 Tax=Propionivibrio soli TaxID=2976531 RepID=UPI0021E81B35|nr:PLP-dependent aminotransferase family protein [Propionivibrio soli]